MFTYMDFTACFI